MRGSRLQTGLIFVVMACVNSAAAQSFEASWNTVDAGGGTSSGGSYTVAGTAGQSDAGPVMSGGPYEVSGGFWPGLVSGGGPTFDVGDLNCDGFITVGDIGAFVLALTNPGGYGAAFPDCDIGLADTNNDGFVTVGDIGAFVALLTGG